MKFSKYVILFLFFISCTDKDNIKEENKYQIINLIYHNFSDDLMTFFAFPVRTFLLPNEGIDYRRMLNDKAYMDSLHKITYSNRISKKDSLLKIKKFIKNKKNQKVFAFDLKMERYHNLNGKKVSDNINGFENLYTKLKASTEIDSLDIKKIFAKNNDSIIKFRKELLKDKVGVEFRKFNILVSFSDIIFNKEETKAIVIGTRTFSGTNSYSLIYFLEKKNGKWIIKYEKGLSIP